MATDVYEPAALDQTPLSIYFGLEPGKSANLEAVAEASLAWVASLREMLAIVEPGASFEVELVDGDRGSLWLNTLIKFLKGAEAKLEQVEKGGAEYPRLWALARGLAIIIIATPVSLTAQNVWQKLVGEEPKLVRLTPEAQQELIEQFKIALQPTVAREERRQFFRAIERDTSINAVGVAPAPTSHAPAALTSRDEFTAFIQGATVDDEAVERARTRTDTVEATLVSPVLENAERSWRFRVQGYPEFGAVMRDRDFLAAIEHGGVHVELRQGIRMVLLIEFKEAFEGGVWRTTERNVREVVSPTYDRNRLL